jgi:hypothetical protein
MKAKKYKRLTLKERAVIERLLQENNRQLKELTQLNQLYQLSLRE